MIPNVLSAAMSHGCTMLHPGYGFLSENAVFVDMCRAHGINFIGPNVSILSHNIYIYMMWSPMIGFLWSPTSA